MPRPRRRNPWTSTGEILVWVLFAVLLFPAGFAGYAVGHYTSLGKPPKTVVSTTTVGSTATPTTSSTPISTSTPTTTSGGGGGGGNVAAGKTVFASNGCANCHTFQPAGSNGTIGPNLDTAPTQDAKADGNMALAAFIHQSIVDPNAYIAKGFTKGLMPTNFGSQLSKTQLNDLVAFIVSGAKS
ncbi:MAG TPA: cytochrome c [Gaiellaceae bacterium]|nr:cytochrome c [Gaiellaceae bacterium]